MSLYLKYRPQALEQVRGNTDTVAILENMLADLATCPHSFLLSGPTGSGKTTIARIIANRVHCKGDDLQELNIANVRGIDTIREIIDNSQYKPMEGTCRVWILDEFHKATADAQNALLKILEDTPKHIYFIICTTEPQKLIETIKSRCSQFQLKPLNEQQMTSLIRRVAHEEGEKLDAAVTAQIIQDSFGLPRGALNILEQVLNTEPAHRLAVAERAAAEQSKSIALCRALLKGVPWKGVSIILNGLLDQEPEGIRRHVMAYCQSVLLKGENDQAGLILERFWEPLYNVGWPGLIYCCYSIIKN